MLVLTSEVYDQILIEEVRLGAEGCCAQLVAVYEVPSDDLERHFRLGGEFSGVRIVDAPSSTKFRFTIKGRMFQMHVLSLQKVRVTEHRSGAKERPRLDTSPTSPNAESVPLLNR